jgi:hypothetical protein
MTTHSELSTITTSLHELSGRITTLVEQGGSLPAEVYTELVSAERTVGTLLRRLTRVMNKVRP